MSYYYAPCFIESTLLLFLLIENFPDNIKQFHGLNHLMILYVCQKEIDKKIFERELTSLFQRKARKKNDSFSTSFKY